MLGFWFRLTHQCFFVKGRQTPAARVQHTLVRTYQAVSSASADILWQKIVNLADVSWHPLLSSTNAPKGLIAKPGLIYQAFTRLCPIPIPIRIFVERVSPREVLSFRIFPVPGLEERVTYQIESTVCGTSISYSVTLRGWLSPLAWSLLRPYAARVASALAKAAEQAATQALPGQRRVRPRPYQDLLGILLAVVGLASFAVKRYWIGA